MAIKTLAELHGGHAHGVYIELDGAPGEVVVRSAFFKALRYVRDDSVGFTVEYHTEGRGHNGRFRENHETSVVRYNYKRRTTND